MSADMPKGCDCLTQSSASQVKDFSRTVPALLIYRPLHSLKEVSYIQNIHMLLHWCLASNH